MMSFDTISHHGLHPGTHGLHGHHGRNGLGSASSLAAAATGAGTAAVSLQPHHGHDHVVTPPPAAFPSGPDPLPLGLAGFSSAVFLTSAHYAGFISSTGWLAPIGMIAGGQSPGWAGLNCSGGPSVGQAVHSQRGPSPPPQQVRMLTNLINDGLTTGTLPLLPAPLVPTITTWNHAVAPQELPSSSAPTFSSSRA